MICLCLDDIWNNKFFYTPSIFSGLVSGYFISPSLFSLTSDLPTLSKLPLSYCKPCPSQDYLHHTTLQNFFSNDAVTLYFSIMDCKSIFVVYHTVSPCLASKQKYNRCTINITTVTFYIIYTPTCFDVSMSSSGSFTFVPCQVT
jgi:hypothetical protein